MKAYPHRGTNPQANQGDGGADFDRAREEARQWVENVQAGCGLALPNSWNPAANKYEWEVENLDPKPIQLGGMLDLVKYIKNEISYGIGVPPELLEAAETGAGWSGRKVPLIVFYTRQLRNARAILWACRQQFLDKLVHWNFGKEAKYEIEPIIKIPSELEPAGQQGAPGQPGGDAGAGAPPAGAAGPGEGEPAPQGGAPMPFAGQPQPVKNGPPIQMATAEEVPDELVPPDDDALSLLTQGPVDYPEEPFTTKDSETLLDWRTQRPKALILPPAPVTGWSDLIATTIPHVRILSETGGGKTTVAQALVGRLPGKVAICDPFWTPGSWGGLPAATVSPDGDFSPIQGMLENLLAELRKRTAQLQEGRKDFDRLNIVMDEVPNTVQELPKIAGDFIRRIANFGRHANMHLLGMGQSATVGSWGLPGFGDVAENFATIYLGSKALDRVPALANVNRPAVLEWQGKLIPIDMSPVLAASGKPLDKSRAWTPLDGIDAKPVTPEVSALSDEAILSELAQEEKHD